MVWKEKILEMESRSILVAPYGEIGLEEAVDLSLYRLLNG